MDFNNEELEMLIISVSRKAHILLDLSCQMRNKNFRGRGGAIPTIEDIRKVKDRSDEYFELLKKLRDFKDSNND